MRHATAEEAAYELAKPADTVKILALHNYESESLYLHHVNYYYEIYDEAMILNNTCSSCMLQIMKFLSEHVPNVILALFAFELAYVNVMSL